MIQDADSQIVEVVKEMYKSRKDIHSLKMKLSGCVGNGDRMNAFVDHLVSVGKRCFRYHLGSDADKGGKMAGVCYFDGKIWVVPIIRGNFQTAWILFSKTVEWRERSCSRTIKCTLNRHNAAQGVVLHVVGEYHQLSYIDKTAELLVRKAFLVHSCALCHHASMIVGLFHFYKA